MKIEYEAKLVEMYERGEGRGYPDTLDLRSLLKRHPNLSAEGLDAKEPHEIDFGEFRIAYEWLEDIRSRNHYKGRHEFVSSYDLKHAAEQAVGKYISNGALIAAGFILGLNKRKHDRGNLNASFKLPPMNHGEMRTLLAAREKCYFRGCHNPVAHTSSSDPKWGVTAISLCHKHLDRDDEIHRALNSD